MSEATCERGDLSEFLAARTLHARHAGLMCPCHGPLISRAQEKGDHNMGAWLDKQFICFVGLQPTVIASRAPHLLLEQSERFKED